MSVRRASNTHTHEHTLTVFQCVRGTVTVQHDSRQRYKERRIHTPEGPPWTAVLCSYDWYPHTRGTSTDCCAMFIWLVSTHPRGLHRLLFCVHMTGIHTPEGPLRTVVLCSYDWTVEILWSRWPGVAVLRSPDSETLISVKVFVNLLLILALFSSFSGSSGSDSVWLMYIFHNSRHFCEQLSQTCLSSC